MSPNWWRTIYLGPVREYELLDLASSLQDIHIFRRGDAQIPTGHLVQ